ncbi:MAG: hypothetical protein HY560_11270 [Gemmatimonadetes bacterium]|nr:hypothetical protein [Gemmatimonadota bacterium]
MSPMRERLRFVDFELRRLQNGRCRARVVLEWHPEQQFIGSAEEIGSQAGELRCAAQAALDAIEHAVEAHVQFELLGVKAVRAFDATVLIVSLSSRDEARASRLVGSYITDEFSARGAALAVLNATNRVLGNIIMRMEKANGGNKP